MFTVFSLRNSRNLTVREETYLNQLLSEYSKTFEGMFLRYLPWWEVKFKWCSGMNVENGIMGAFSPVQPDTVFLQNTEMPEAVSRTQPGRVSWLELLFPTIIHELRHKWQFKNHPVPYVLCCMPLLRSFTIERDAEAAAKKAESWVGNWGKKQDAINMQKRIHLMGGYSDEQNIFA